MDPNQLTGSQTVGLALGSGAARGWAHIGVIHGLLERGIRPQVVCGSSMGAVVGGVYAAGALPSFEEWALRLDWRDLVGYFDLSMRGGLIKARRIFETMASALPDADIESLPCRFAAVATDLATGREVWIRRGKLFEALRASVALPGLVTPASQDGRWLVDGGLVNPVPVSLCRALGAQHVIAVDLNSTLLGRRFRAEAVPEEMAEDANEDPELEPASALRDSAFGRALGGALQDLAEELRHRLLGDDAEREVLPSVYEVMANSLNIMQMRISRSRMAGDPPDLLVTPRLADFGLLDFDRAEEAIAEGRRAVARALASVDTDLGSPA